MSLVDMLILQFFLKLWSKAIFYFSQPISPFSYNLNLLVCNLAYAAIDFASLPDFV